MVRSRPSCATRRGRRDSEGESKGKLNHGGEVVLPGRYAPIPTMAVQRKREAPATGCACTRQRRALTCVSPRKEALRYGFRARRPHIIRSVPRRVLTWRGDVTAERVSYK